MVKVDEFQSLFRAAEREPFRFEPPPLGRVVLVIDDQSGDPEPLWQMTARFLPALATAEWSAISVDSLETVADVVDEIAGRGVDLIVTVRHVGEAASLGPGAMKQSTGGVPRHSLGVYLDVLTQAAAQPVLVLPGTSWSIESVDRPARSTVVVTDHIRGESRLIGSAAALSPPGSRLWLCHVEDEAVFERYLAAIAQIPELDTDLARTRIAETLLDEAREYLTAAKAGLEAAGRDWQVIPQVSVGHPLTEFKRLVESHTVDLVVMNTKDDDQLAMHGTAYAIAVELVDTPLLLL